MDLPKKYKPQELEPKWQSFWEKEHIFAFDSQDVIKPIFSIDTPPPTVSGKMHLGHAFGNSQQDFIARYKRMKGYNVLQPFGTDDNGLPTKLLIEKTKKVSSAKMPRKEFRELCLKTLNDELKPSYIRDWKRLGISCDFSITYSTIDKHSQKVSQESFLDLYKKGREYRAQAPAMYCPKCRTAISQVECEDEEQDSLFNDIIFTCQGEQLTIATTRPELLPACVAVFYHPDDVRYQHLKDKEAKVPLFDMTVPILPDEQADPQKGTGLVMCCTFGDQTDMDWQKKHHLPIKEAIGHNGRMTSLAESYEGLKIQDARKKIIEDLKENELLIASKPIKHAVNVHERCGTPIEFVHSKQWFVRYLDLKKDMLEWGKEFTWLPTHMKNRYDNWVKGLAWDWCISRQLPFGIPFPVWYCKNCDEVILAQKEDLPVDPVEEQPSIKACPHCGKTEFTGETDILNTWATSSLSPTIVKELFRGTPVYDRLVDNPMDLRPQGHDIISFWLFNTVVKSKLHYDMVPWKTAFINGWLLDSKGKKMSKSKGNVVEPQKIIEKYSADALRFMAATSTLGEDLPFPEKDVVTGKKTVTKIFNAAKFVHMFLDGYDTKITPEKASLEPIDKWILSSLQETIQQATTHFDNFSYFKAKTTVDKFFWKVLCDNYLEIVKDRLYKPELYGKDSKQAGLATLYKVLLETLQLYAPFIPFVTEEVYSWFYKQNHKNDVGEQVSSIHLTKWPEKNKDLVSEKEQRAGDLLIHVLSAIRSAKSKEHVSQKHVIKELRITCHKEEKELLEVVESSLKRTGHVNSLHFVVDEKIVPLDQKVTLQYTLAPKEEN